MTWPGETNGIPNGLNVNLGGPLGAILPSAICGDMGPCVPIGMGFDPAGLHGPNQTATDLFAGVFSTLWGVIYSVGWTNDTRRLFNTSWCGPGGGGTTNGAVDIACKQHDDCYGSLTGLDNFRNLLPSQAAKISACNQQLCNAVRNEGSSGRLIYDYFSSTGRYRCQ